MPKIRTYTDETELGFINSELDAVYTAIDGAGVGALADVPDVTITSPADDEVLAYDSGGDWINQTAAEAGLATTADLGNYLPIAGGTLSGNLMFYKDNPLIQLYDSGEATYTWIYHNGAGVSFDFSWNGVVHSRYMNATGTWELAAGVSQPTVNTTNAVSFYQDADADVLWATWKDSVATHHAPVARAKRTVISLTPGEAVLSGTVSYQPIGANTDVSAIRFTNAGTGTAVWSFTRPYDWDYGQIQVTVYWTNYDANVTGNHYWPQRLIGCQSGEHLASTQTCNTLISGAQTTAGLNNSSKIGTTAINGSAETIGNEAIMFYRIQRQGGHGSDTSGQSWEVIHITIKLIAT